MKLKFMKIIAIIAMLGTIFLFAGCELEGTDTGSDTISPQSAFIGGSYDSFSLSFIEGAPPMEVFDGNKFPFSVNIQVENKGEWDILDPTKFSMKLSGIDPTVFNNPNLVLESSQALMSKKRDLQGTIIDGTITNLVYPGFSYTPELQGHAQFVIKADACFNYGTKAVVTNMCVKSNLLDTLDTSVCSVNEGKATDNSIAPVIVTDFKESALSNNMVSLTFAIEHKGDGLLFLKDSSCNNDIVKKNIVYFSIDTGKNAGLKCQCLQDANGNPLSNSIEGYVTLYPSGSSLKRVITCTQEFTDAELSDYTKVVNFKLEYDYKKSIQKEILVRHI